MKAEFFGISIKGIACSLPKEKFNLFSLDKLFGEKEVKRIISSTGISCVRIAKEGVRTSDLCTTASQELLKKTNVTSAEIDGIIFISQTSDQIMPATSVVLQDRLGLSKDVVAFDLNYGCSGYIYGLYLACNLLISGGCKKILVCAGDVITPYLHPSDKNVRMVFGDGGSATLIEKGRDKINFIIKTDGSGAEILKLYRGANSYLFMDGYKIMEFALKEVPLIINDILDFRGWCKDDVDTYALHQPNMFMLNYLLKKMKLNKAAVPIAIDGIGNTSSASIPITLCNNQEKLIKNKKLKNVVMCGFGVGLSWGACTLNLDETIILPLIEI